MELGEEGILAARRDPASLAGYLELHIEQGPVLEQAGIDIGIVTGIVGASSFTVVFDGAARHAGTTPMGNRRDAAVGAAAFVLGVRETAANDFPGCVATVGDITTLPGSFNVVPGRAGLRLECRSLSSSRAELPSSRRSSSEHAARPSPSASTSRSSGSVTSSLLRPTRRSGALSRAPHRISA